MPNCLVTTLKDAVSDSSLLYIDELAFTYENDTTLGNVQVKMASTKEAGEMTIVGDCYFTDSTGTENFGKTTTIPNNTSKTAYIYGRKCTLHIRNKYNISTLVGYALFLDSDTIFGSTGNLYNFVCKYSGDVTIPLNAANATNIGLTGTGYKYGDITVAENHSTTMQYFDIREGEDVTGNISTLAELSNLVSASIQNCPKISGNVSALQGKSGHIILVSLPLVNGNISAFGNNTALLSLSVKGTGVTGDISSLAGDTALQTLDVSNTTISGNTSSLSSLTNLTTFAYANSNVTGTWPLT